MSLDLFFNHNCRITKTTIHFDGLKTHLEGKISSWLDQINYENQPFKIKLYIKKHALVRSVKDNMDSFIICCLGCMEVR